MTIYLGDFPTGKTIYVPFHTFNSSGASVTITGLAVTDIEVYRNGSVTQRASDAGYALLDTDGIDFDGLTGIHGFSIDTSDNTDSGFYAAGYDYWVVVSAITVDAQTVSFVAATFSIDNRQLLRPTVASRTLDVSAGGEAGVDWANVGSPTTTVSLSGTTVATATNLTNAPTAGDLTATMKASVNTEVDAAIETYHLDHLLAVTYDPASKPGAADALLNELVESDAGVARFTANALEQAPTGGGDGGLITSGTAAAISATSITLASGHGISDTTVQVVLTGGTNAVGKDRIATYSGTGDVFNVDPAWNATVAGNAETTPSGTITYEVYPAAPAPTTYPLTSNVTQLAGDAQSLTDLKDFADAGYDPATNKVQGVVLTDTVTTYTGNTPQTGDSFARLGAPAGASIAADIAVIESQTDDIGVAGAGLTALATQASVNTIDDFLDTEIAAILAAVDTEVAAIKAKTDSLTFTQAGHVDANIQRINDVAITGNGQTGTEFGI